jgi:hypothetical protein
MVIVTTGPVVSSTVTLNAPVSESPSESVTVQLTAVVPSAKVLPDGGLQTGCGSGLSSASVALAE